MPDPIALAQAGPVAILLVGIGLLAWAFIKGWIVPGWLYIAQVKRAEAAEEIARKAVAAVEKVTATVQKSLDERARASKG